MLPGKRCSAGGVRNTVASASGSIAGDRRRVERADPALELERTGERLLDGHLLVEREPDQQRERIGGDEGVGVRVAGEREVVGRDGQAHGDHRTRLAWRDADSPLRRHRWVRSPSASGGCSTSRRATTSRAAAIHVRDARDRGDRGPRRRRSRRRAASSTSPGLTVVPGLIDTHSHLVGEVQSAGVPGTTTSAAQDALLGVGHARATIEAGFTSVRDVGTVPGVRRLRAARRDQRRRRSTGPRMQCAGAFITAPWGGGDVVGLAHDIRLPDDLRFGVVTSAAEVRERVRRLMIGGADLVKCIGTGAVLTKGGVPGAPELSEEEIRAAVEEAAPLRQVRRRPRALVRGRPAGDPGRRPLGRARIDRRRRDDRDARGHGHLLLGRPVRRRVGARARAGRGLAGRDDGTSSRTPWSRGSRSCARRSSAASGSSTGPTAACTRTRSSRSSSRGTSAAG